MGLLQSAAENLKNTWSARSLGKHVTLRSLLLGGLGISLLLIGTIMTPAAKEKEQIPQPQKIVSVESAVRSYEEVLEGKLANKLSQIQGVGAVIVTITLETGPQQEYAKNIVQESRVVQEKDNAGGTRQTTEIKANEQVLMSRESGTDRPVVAREYKPQIRGVLVVAEGASDSRVKAQLTRAVETGLGVPSYKIMVLPQKG